MRNRFLNRSTTLYTARHLGISRGSLRNKLIKMQAEREAELDSVSEIKEIPEESGFGEKKSPRYGLFVKNDTGSQPQIDISLSLKSHNGSI